MSIEKRVYPIPFRTRKSSSSSPMILQFLLWESRTMLSLFFYPLFDLIFTADPVSAFFLLILRLYYSILFAKFGYVFFFIPGEMISKLFICVRFASSLIQMAYRPFWGPIGSPHYAELLKQKRKIRQRLVKSVNKSARKNLK